MVLDVPLGKKSYYAIRVEFQVIWIVNTPKLSKETKDEYIQWVDSIIKTDMPISVSEKELFELGQLS